MRCRLTPDGALLLPLKIMHCCLTLPNHARHQHYWDFWSFFRILRHTDSLLQVACAQYL